MSFLAKILGKQKPREMTDTEFGSLHQIRDGWEGHEFSLWGSAGLQVLVDAGDEGPSEEQRQFLRTLQGERASIRGRVEEAVATHAAETTAVRPIVLRLTSFYIPKLERHFTWRVWYEVEGEEHWSFGAEVRDWEEIVPFAED